MSPLSRHLSHATLAFAAFGLLIASVPVLAGHPALTDDAGVLARAEWELEASTTGDLSSGDDEFGVALRRGLGRSLDLGVAFAATQQARRADRLWSSAMDVKWSPFRGAGPIPSVFVRADARLATEDDWDAGYAGGGAGLTWEFDRWLVSGEFYSVATRVADTFDAAQIGRQIVVGMALLPRLQVVSEYARAGSGNDSFDDFMLGGVWAVSDGFLSSGLRWSPDDDTRYLSLAWTMNWGQ